MISIYTMPECELVYHLFNGGNGGLNLEWERYHNELKARFGVYWLQTSQEYRDNMIAEYILLYKDDNVNES